MSPTPLPEWEVAQSDALDWLRSLPDDHADLILTDPPYFEVVEQDWDNAWDSDGEFLEWLGEILDECRRVLTPSGSLYVFASPRMAARVEVAISERFRVLAPIVWVKDRFGQFGQQSKAQLRNYWHHSERIVFAEQGQAARDVARRHHAHRREVFESLRLRLVGLRDAAKLTNAEVDRALGTNGMAGHYFGASQWHLPTREAWGVVAEMLAARGVVPPSFDELSAEHDRLAKPFDDGAIGRPFRSEGVRKDDYRLLTDVWHFDVPPLRKEDRHPCEKPVDLLRHAVRMSSRPGELVLDPFTGSGSTGEAALLEGRRFSGCDQDPRWVKAASRRLRRVAPATVSGSPLSSKTGQLSIFDFTEGEAA